VVYGVRRIREFNVALMGKWTSGAGGCCWREIVCGFGCCQLVMVWREGMCWMAVVRSLPGGGI
jgi:hypothetical protein